MARTWTCLWFADDLLWAPCVGACMGGNDCVTGSGCAPCACGRLVGLLTSNSSHTGTRQARIRDLVVKTVLTGEDAMARGLAASAVRPGQCYELLGFDVLVDASLQPWLIEVCRRRWFSLLVEQRGGGEGEAISLNQPLTALRNLGRPQVNLLPSLGASTDLDATVKGHMLADLFTMIGIHTPTDGGRLHGSHRATAAATCAHCGNPDTTTKERVCTDWGGGGVMLCDWLVCALCFFVSISHSTTHPLTNVRTLQYHRSPA